MVKIFLLVGLVVAIACTIAGLVLLPSAFTIAGRGDRERGKCLILGGKVSSFGRGSTMVRTLFAVTIYESLNVTVNSTVYQNNTVAFEGDLSSSATYSGIDQRQRAQGALDAKPVGSILNCIFPAQSKKYPNFTNSVYENNVAFVGDYSDEEIQAAKTKFNRMLISGSVLLSVGAFSVILFIVLLALDYRKKSNGGSANIEMDSAHK
eukprot:TRINITY_DN9220_c0_g1_i1.p1 TRINITY_DN9220_c0_g1~~TRINITY_DN9220_c0_g1_i1.p1  ORF type:complete len:207 (+),score=43.35 TRINITY_DN9220_c0_g1_i1:107-727(+)